MEFIIDFQIPHHTRQFQARNILIHCHLSGRHPPVYPSNATGSYQVKTDNFNTAKLLNKNGKALKNKKITFKIKKQKVQGKNQQERCCQNQGQKHQKRKIQNHNHIQKAEKHKHIDR